MIHLIFEMLALTEHYGVSETIEIAKGKYELVDNLADAKKQAKRNKEWQRLKKQ